MALEEWKVEPFLRGQLSDAPFNHKITFLVNKNMVEKAEKEKFPYKSEYYHLIKGKTISRRGRWWTAVLLVQNVDNADKRVVVIQRWQKRNRADPEADGNISSYWAPAKAFTLNSSKPWATLKETVSEWLESNDWK